MIMMYPRNYGICTRIGISVLTLKTGRFLFALSQRITRLAVIPGSPVLDAEGNLIGLNFDRAWEGVMSDMQYSPEICRNIAVRYSLCPVYH